MTVAVGAARTAVVACACMFFLTAAAPAAPAHAQGESAQTIDLVLYQSPSTSAVIDPFRPPSQFAGPGNRGLEFGGQDQFVAAAADGLVLFAGPIGGTHYVTLWHNDGLTTTYSFLDELWAVQGQEVNAGFGIGLSGPAGWHFGVIAGSHYLDPEVLLAASQPTERLVLGPPP